MSATDRGLEVKVGALVVFSLALLAAFIFILGDVSFDEGVIVQVDYDDIGGLKPGAPVKQAGVEIGSVREIDYRGGVFDEAVGRPVWARVALEIDPEHADSVRANSDFHITSEGVLGEKFVSVQSPDPTAPPAPEDAVFRGTDPMRLEQMVTKVSQSLDSLNALIGDSEIPIKDLVRHVDQLAVHVDALIVDNREEIDALIGGAGALMGDARTFVNHADETLVESRPQLRSILGHVDVAAADARGTLAQARATMTRVDGLIVEVRAAISPMVSSARAALADVQALSNKLLGVVNDAEPRVRLMLDDAHASIQNVHAITDSALSMVAFVETGQGTLGGLLRDEEIYDNLREMLRELKRHPWKIVWKE